MINNREELQQEIDARKQQYREQGTSMLVSDDERELIEIYREAIDALIRH